MNPRLMALAMNPNLTEAEFLSASKAVMDGRTKMLEDATAAILKLPPECRLQAFISVIPWLVT